jgi:hypothetical protein
MRARVRFLRIVALLSLAVVFLTHFVFAEITLTDRAGAKTTGEVLRVTREEALLEVNRQRTAIKLNDLSDTSRAAVVADAQKKGVHTPFPPLRVQPIVGTQQRRLGTSSYRKEMEIAPRATVEAVNRLAPLPEAEATMIVITMDTRAKYTARQEVYRVHDAQTVKLSAAATGERRQIAFEPSSVTYDSYRDNSNIGGEVYKYFIFGLRDAESKTVVDFQTNHPQLAALCKKDHAKREEFLVLKKGAKFPSDIK